ncbi:proprotein convertase subtilisin/kexin type 5-like isoform X2 [Haliotis rubra]|uniref:proprotein convertase subtilisin/kexin type 5-like isoform X2 n=1 Tax=Haliotis rubra TaxID=36100 RepID=UPI001EE5885A|nr:proprotein convertase subtilisin/kexin type 5-like isoform X2 [Haliotis rubra]
MAGGVYVVGVMFLVICAVSADTRCVKTCKGIPSGKYQSCSGCNQVIACYHGFKIPLRCPCGTVWDDQVKRCQQTSSTCLERGNNPCITNCTALPDGNYQSCKGCSLYASCRQRRIRLNKCSPGTFWDDSLKRCEKNSSTCPGPTLAHPWPHPGPSPPSNRCVSSCAGVRDGDYQSCIGCQVFASCAHGQLFDNRTCPGNLVWDDFYKRCEGISTTCPTGAPSPCMKNCTGKPDLTYQSCTSCKVHAKCDNGKLTDNITCPSGLLWDDSLKRCEKTSKTCTPKQPQGALTEIRKYPCITNCTGMNDGDYQSCKGCNVYTICSNGNTFVMPCSAKTVWDDAVKRCQGHSTTCPGSDYLTFEPQHTEECDCD